jgi:hypothetical protein
MNPEKRTILPSLAFRGFASRYKRPQISEGFQDITEVAFKVRLSHVTSMNVDLTDYDACSFMDPKLNVKFGLGTGPDVHDRNL